MQTHAKSRVGWLITLLVCGLIVGSSILSTSSTAQFNRPILVSREDSTRAIAFESVTRQREPFNATAPIQFGSDPETRIMLFAMNLHLQPGETPSAVTADAEDANHNIHNLVVEHLGAVPDQPWATSITLRLNQNMTDLGDVLVRIKYSGVASNRVRVGIGHLGGGPADDPNSVPTPGTESLVIPPALPKATNLTTADIQALISQAASAAIALGHPVNIIVTDRNALDAPELGIELASALLRLYPQQYKIDRMPELLVEPTTFDAIVRGDDPRRIADEWRDSLEQFQNIRKKYLIY